MNDIVLNGICEILTQNQQKLRIPLRQRAKFEGWLKFELAYYLERSGYSNVHVEGESSKSVFRSDIRFTAKDGTVYCVELKTANTNWQIDGVDNKTKPITKNIASIIADCLKMKSLNGVMAFVLFPIPIKDNRWETYLNTISHQTGIALNKELNCRSVMMEVDDDNRCEAIVCTFASGLLTQPVPLK